jgi:hypothetical protein
MATATAWACGGGDDNVIPDGGGDATTDTGNGNDAAKDSTASDVANDVVTGNDSGGDAAPDSAGGDAGSQFACGTTTCDSKTQYCEKAQKGLDGGLPDASQLPDAAKIDGGTIEVDTCLTYPTSCTADGGSPSCTCIPNTTGCTCAQSGSDITTTCK